MHPFLSRGALRLTQIRIPRISAGSLVALPAALLLGALAGCGAAPAEEIAEPHLVGGTDVDRGRYLVVVGGCNDCHTDGYLQTEGAVPEDRWLTGSPLGWRGPWGTTYPANLRLSVGNMTEDGWVSLLRTRKDRPPMPWTNVNRMSEPDMRALYRYIVSLGATGEVMPAAVLPDVEPSTPYLSMMPVVPGT